MKEETIKKRIAVFEYIRPLAMKGYQFIRDDDYTITDDFVQVSEWLDVDFTPLAISHDA